MDQTALIIGYALMCTGGFLIVSFLIWLMAVLVYKAMTHVANALTQRLINLHGLKSVKAMYQQQEQNGE